MLASAFALTLSIPAEGFEIVAGEMAIGGLRGREVHHHCGARKSRVFTRVEALDFFVNLRPTRLDEHRRFAPFVEVCTSEVRGPAQLET